MKSLICINLAELWLNEPRIQLQHQLFWQADLTSSLNKCTIFRAKSVSLTGGLRSPEAPNLAGGLRPPDLPIWLGRLRPPRAPPTEKKIWRADRNRLEFRRNSEFGQKFGILVKKFAVDEHLRRRRKSWASAKISAASENLAQICTFIWL